MTIRLLLLNLLQSFNCTYQILSEHDIQIYVCNLKLNFGVFNLMYKKYLFDN